MKRNPSQQEAVLHKDGPMLVLAGPGSGKTAVITQRTRYLITNYHIPPSNILVITFTKAAAQEMKQRFQKLMGDQNCPVTFGTFHAVFFSILRHAYHYTAANIVKEEQKYQCMRDIIAKHRLEYEDETEFIQSVLGEISMIKNAGISLDHYYSSNCAEEVFRRIYSEYHEFLYRSKLIDFDDMLVYTYELFAERPDILSAWQKKYSYILIDEFQDINKVQFDVVKQLAGVSQNLFVVGDDDQSIYRFRGAKPEIMLHFKDDFPKTKTVLLDQNYRSLPQIVEKSLNLIGHNKERFLKEIHAARKEETVRKEEIDSEGKRKNQQLPSVEYDMFQNQREENLYLISKIQEHLRAGVGYEEMAILFRTNTQPRLCMEQLLEYNIPFCARDSIPNLYTHWIARDIFSYIRISQGSRSRKDFLQIMNRPKRYLSRESLEEEQVAFDVWEDFYEEQHWVAERIQQLEYDIHMLKRMSPYAAINYIRRGIGYDDFCKEYAQYRHIKEEELFEVLEELLSSAKGYSTYEAWFAHIEEYTKELEEMYQKQHENRNGIILSTLHSAKGLEYQTVFILDVNEGVMPYKKAVLEADIEEERRLFYVGMTRAKDRLYLFSVQKLNNKEMQPSRFIEETQKSSQKNSSTR